MGKLPSRPTANDLRDHGIAVYSGACSSVNPWRDAATGRDYVYCGINGTPSLIVQVDVATGRCRTFNLPEGFSGPRVAFTLAGDVLATGPCGRVVHINPQTGEFRVAAKTGKFNWTMTRGADGKFYIGTSPGCHLFRYDAVTEQLEDLGSVAPTEVYLRHVVDGRDGYIYCSVGCTASQIMAYHIATGKITPLLPESAVAPYFLDEFGRGRDGQIYLVTNRGRAYRFAHGAAFPVKDVAAVKRLLMLIEYWPGYSELPDGRPIVKLDPDAIQIGEGSKAKIIQLKYKTEGTGIFHLAEGPNQTVYASTIMPLYVLRYTPATNKLENLGRGGPDNGEVYSFGHCDGKLYYANYPSGNLMGYDPAQPLHKDPPGAMQWKTNPRWIGNLGTGNCRPRAMTIDSQKRVWIGGFPEYGYRHGGMACYDTIRKKLKLFPKVIPDQSIDALAADETGSIIYGGSNIGRNGGMPNVATGSYLFAWDTRKQKVAWKAVPVPEMKHMSNLLYRDGKLYGTVGFQFFCFDVATRKTDYVVQSEISGPRPHSLSFGPDGNLYGITWMVLYRWRPETGKIEELYRCLGDDAKPFASGSLFHRGAVIINGRIYFSCGPKVMSLRLPLETKTK